jgi:hypothetical protein
MEWMIMRDRGALYVGILLLLLGLFFLFIEAAGSLLAPLGLRFGWAQAWPFIILFVGLAFWLPILIWWGQRENLSGLAVPGTIILTVGLILLYQNVTGDWRSWSYMWAFIPMSVGLGLLAIYGLGKREQGLLVAAGIVSGIGLVFFVIFASAFGGLIRLLGPAALILIGVFILMRGLQARAAGTRDEWPEE